MRSAPKRLDRHPGFQRAEAARQVGTEVARPRVPGGEAALGPLQIGGGHRERLLVRIAVANQEEPGVVRHVPPFVEIERDRIRLFDPLQQRAKLRRERRQRPDRAIDMEPEAFARRHLRYALKRIDSPCVHGACSALQ